MVGGFFITFFPHYPFGRRMRFAPKGKHGFRIWGNFGGPGWTGGRWTNGRATPSDYAALPKDTYDSFFREHDADFESRDPLVRAVSDVRTVRAIRSLLNKKSVISWRKPEWTNWLAANGLAAHSWLEFYRTFRRLATTPFFSRRFLDELNFRERLLLGQNAKDALFKRAEEYRSGLVPYKPPAFDPRSSYSGWKPVAQWNTQQENPFPPPLINPYNALTDAAIAQGIQHEGPFHEDSNGYKYTSNGRYRFDGQQGLWVETREYRDYLINSGQAQLAEAAKVPGLRERLQQAEADARRATQEFKYLVSSTWATFRNSAPYRYYFCPETGPGPTQKIGRDTYLNRLDYRICIRDTDINGAVNGTFLVRVLIFTQIPGGGIVGTDWPDLSFIFPLGINGFIGPGLASRYHFYFDKTVPMTRVVNNISDQTSYYWQGSIHFNHLLQREVPLSGGQRQFPTNTLFYYISAEHDTAGSISSHFSSFRLVFDQDNKK